VQGANRISRLFLCGEQPIIKNMKIFFQNQLRITIKFFCINVSLEKLFFEIENFDEITRLRDLRRHLIFLIIHFERSVHKLERRRFHLLKKKKKKIVGSSNPSILFFFHRNIQSLDKFI